MKEQKSIKTKNNIFKYNHFSPDVIVNKACVFYGQSNTGKSFLLNECLRSIRNEVFVLIAYASTALLDKMFPLDKYTHRPLIYEKLDIHKLEKIVQASEERTKIYNMARDEKRLEKASFILHDVYTEKGDRDALTKFEYLNKIIQRINKKKKQAKNKPELFRISDQAVHIYRYMMSEGLIYIRKHNISLDKYDKTILIPLLFVRLNPKIAILFNDLSEELKSLKNSEKTTFIDLFNRGRHSNITTIVLAQGPTQVEKKIRDQAHVNVFTTSESVNGWLAASASDAFLKSKMKDAILNILVPDEKRSSDTREYPKLLYSREKGIFYVTADPMGKQCMVGNKKVLKAIKKLELSKIDSIDKNLLDILV